MTRVLLRGKGAGTHTGSVGPEGNLYRPERGVSAGTVPAHTSDVAFQPLGLPSACGILDRSPSRLSKLAAYSWLEEIRDPKKHTRDQRGRVLSAVSP